MSNTLPATADLYAVVDITKKNEKYLREKNSNIPVCHVWDSENNADSRSEIEVDEKTSMNVMDKYSVVDVSKKGNKIQGQPKGTLLDKYDDSKKLKIAGSDLFHYAVMPIAVVAIIVVLCFIVLLVIILFAITFKNISELNTKIEASVNNFHSSIEVITSNFTTFVDHNNIINNPYLYINSLPSSCSETSKINAGFSSGYYTVKSSSGDLRGVYCDLNRTFGGNSTGWMKVAELDVNNCPQGFRNEIVGADNTCVVFEDSAGCTEIHYPVYKIQHTKITGRIQAYQINSLDGFVSHNSTLRNGNAVTNSVYSNYLDGISLTTNGLHVWSFAAGCDCNKWKPVFINEDYTCGGIEAALEPYQEIWESQQCHRNSTWFFRSLPPSTADIEVRVCRDQARADEDLAIASLELYIQ